MAVRDVGRLDGVARDLRESPFPLELDLSGLPDGVYTLEAEVFDADASLGAARLGIVLMKGLDARLRALEAGEAAAPRRSAPTSAIRATSSATSTAVA